MQDVVQFITDVISQKWASCFPLLKCHNKFCMVFVLSKAFSWFLCLECILLIYKTIGYFLADLKERNATTTLYIMKLNQLQLLYLRLKVCSTPTYIPHCWCVFVLLLYSSLREVCCCSKQQHRYARVFIVLKPFLNCSYSLSTNISTILSRSVACKTNSLPTLWSIDGKRYFWETYSHESPRILFFVQVCFLFLLLCDLFFWYV